MDPKVYFEGWKQRVQPFAEAVEKNLDDVSALLAVHTGDPVDEKSATAALEVLSSKEAFSDEELIKALESLNIPLGKLKLNLAKLRGVPVVAPDATVAAVATSASVGAGPAFNKLAILPAVPDESSFLEMLKTGGVLKVQETEVVSAVKAAFAKMVGLYELPDKILAKMEEFALKQDEPCGEAFYKLQKMLTQKRYGEILTVLGVDGNYANESRKKEFLKRLDSKLWDALINFHAQLKQWVDTWTQGMSTPNAMMMVLAAGAKGAAGLPPGLMEAPDVTPLRSAAEEVVNDINRIFAGPGIPVARALAFDATRIMGILSDPTLPALTGAATKEQMLKDLKANVGNDIIRTEQNVTRYILAIMSLPKVPSDSEVNYFSAMIELGNAINWNIFTGKLSGKLSGIGSATV